MSDIVDIYQLAAMFKVCDNCNTQLPAKPSYEHEFAFCSAACLLAHRVKRWRKQETLAEVPQQE